MNLNKLTIALIILIAAITIQPLIQQKGGMVCGDTAAGYVPCPSPGETTNEWEKYLDKQIRIMAHVKDTDCGLQWSGTKGGVGGVGANERAAKFDCETGHKGDPLYVTKKGENYYIKNANKCGLQWSGAFGQSTPVGAKERVAKFDCDNDGDPMLIEGTPDKFYLRTEAKDKICGFEWSSTKGSASGIGSQEHLAKFDCEHSRGDPLKAEIASCDCPEGYRPAPQAKWNKKYSNKWPNCTNHEKLGCTSEDINTMKAKCENDPDCDGFSVSTSGKGGCYKTKCHPDNVAGYGEGGYDYYEKEKNGKNRCIANWSNSCGEGCAKSKCDTAKGAWIPLDYSHNPYTCEMPCNTPCPCPPGYRNVPGNHNTCVANWSSSCGQGCAKKKCDTAKGKWIPKDYSHNPYTCEMSCNN